MHHSIDDLILLFGPSGSGKRTITGLLEDHHNYVAISKVDPSSMAGLIEHDIGSKEFWHKLVINVGMDEVGGSDLKTAGERYINDCLSTVKRLHALVDGRLRVLFLYCNQANLLKRQTYGYHPLLAATGSIEAAIFKECEILIQVFTKLADETTLNVCFLDTTVPTSWDRLGEELDAHLRPASGMSFPQNFQSRGWNRMGALARKVERLKTKFATEDANSKTGCLIVGETGAGKNYLAEMLHVGDGKFVVLDCTAINPNLIEAELFGALRGAYTDAVEDRPGRVAAAQNGTLLLDEIGLLDTHLQAKLLRLIETRKYYALGDDVERTLKNCRIIAATSRNLEEEEIPAGRFLRDLYHRLATVQVTVPSLRDRREDIPKLMEHFRKKCCSDKSFSSEVMAMLFDYDWPGNIRQMNQVVRRFQLLADDPEVGVADLQQRISSRYPGYRKLHDHLSNRTRAKVASDRQAVSVEDDLHFRKSALDARLEKDRAEAESLKIMLYRDAVKLCGGNHTKAALLLGVDRNQIDRTLKEETAKSAAETD